MLLAGNTMPLFKLPNQNGEIIDIETFIGKKNLVIYFYPKDETPGCTAQACSFRDKYEDFLKLEAEVIGISIDSISAHQKFTKKHTLPFTLLSDSNKEVASLFKIPRTFFILPSRITFIINKKGKIIYTFNDLVQATKHIDVALEKLKQL